MPLLQEPGAAAAYGSVLDYPLHPSTLQQLQRIEPATDWAEAGTRALWACAAAVAGLQLDAAQDAALLAAAGAAGASTVQTSYLRSASAAVSSSIVHPHLNRKVSNHVPLNLSGLQPLLRSDNAEVVLCQDGAVGSTCRGRCSRQSQPEACERVIMRKIETSCKAKATAILVPHQDTSLCRGASMRGQTIP